MIKKNITTLKKDNKKNYKSKVILFFKLANNSYSIKEKIIDSEYVKDFINKNKKLIL